MSKTRVARFFNHCLQQAQKHKPEILIGMGIAGFLTTGVFVARGTVKAVRLLDEKKAQTTDGKLTRKEVVETTWKCYIPATISAGVSIGCLIGASSENAKRNAVLATAYTLSETALTEYKEKVVETIGEKKEQAIQDKIAQDQVTKNPVIAQNVILTGCGNTLCYDAMTGRYFRHDIDKIHKAENRLNTRLRSENYISLNDFYYEIGLESVDLGNDLGWNSDHEIEIRPSSMLTEDEEPCYVIRYMVAPRYDYRNLH